MPRTPDDSSGDSVARRSTRTLTRFLANRRTAQYALAGLGLVIAATLLPLQFLGVSGASGAAASSSPAFIIAYAVVALSILACEVPRVSSMLRRLSRGQAVAPKASGSAIACATPLASGEIARVLRAKGYRRLATTDEAVWGVRHAWAPLGDLMFHFGILLVMAASLASATVARHEATRSYPVQSVTSSAGAARDTRDASRVLRGYTLKSVRAFMDGKVITDLRAVVTDTAGRDWSVEPAAPLILGPGKLLLVDGWGYAADVSLSGTESVSTPFRTTVRIPALHERATSHPLFIAAGGATYRVTLTVDDSRLSARTGRPSLHTARLPRIRATVGVREKDGTYRLVERDVTLARSRETTVAGIVLGLTRQRPYAAVRTIESWSILPMLLGLTAITVGLIWRLGIGRRDAVVERRATGWHVSVKADAYRLATAEAERICRALEGR